MRKLPHFVLVGALAAVAVMCAFPPWEYQAKSGTVRPVGYSFIAAPPDVPLENNAGEVVRVVKATRINTSRLLVQIVGALALGGAGLLLARGRNE